MGAGNDMSGEFSFNSSRPKSELGSHGLFVYIDVAVSLSSYEAPIPSP
jgi:hypothetical protein